MGIRSDKTIRWHSGQGQNRKAQLYTQSGQERVLYDVCVLCVAGLSLWLGQWYTGKRKERRGKKEGNQKRTAKNKEPRHLTETQNNSDKQVCGKMESCPPTWHLFFLTSKEIHQKILLWGGSKLHQYYNILKEQLNNCISIPFPTNLFPYWQKSDSRASNEYIRIKCFRCFCGWLWPYGASLESWLIWEW